MYPRFSFTDWVTPFGLLFITAIVAAWLLARRNAQAARIDPSHVDLIVPLAIIVGIAGGTAFSLLIPADQTVAGEALDPGPRLRLFGFLGAGAVGLFIYSRFVRLSFRRLLDVFTLPTLTGLMVHRVGCYLAGCCWGDVVGGDHAGEFAAQVQTTSFLEGVVRGVQYPPGSLAYEQHEALGLIDPGALASLPVYPVQIYEAALLAMLLLVLSRVPWRQVPRGTLAILSVVAYAVTRFFIEYLRADNPVVLGNLTVTQLQCIILAFSVVLLPRIRERVVS